MFESSTISFKRCNAPFKETQLPSVWKEHCLKEMFYSQKLNQLHLLKVTRYTMIWKYVTILSMTPFLCKYVTLLSKNSSCALLGQEHHLFEGKVSFSKNIILHPQRLHTWKGKLHIPKEYCACLAYILFFVMTSQECLGGKMNQIWFALSGLILRNQKSKETKKTKKAKKKKKQCFPD